MSSPVSSRVLVIVEEALEGSVLGRGVVSAGVPAVPYDVQPGAGEDAYGVGVVVAAGEGAVVQVGGPGVGSPGVAGEVADGVAKLFVAGPSESDRAYLAGLSGRGGDTGQAGQRFGGWESGAAVADLAEQSGGADGAGAGQAGEDVGVGVGVELLGDLLGEGLDLLDEGVQGRQQRTGDVGCGGAGSPVAPRGALVRRACSTAGSMRPQ